MHYMKKDYKLKWEVKKGLEKLIDTCLTHVPGILSKLPLVVVGSLTMYVHWYKLQTKTK